MHPRGSFTPFAACDEVVRLFANRQEGLIPEQVAKAVEFREFIRRAR